MGSVNVLVLQGRLTSAPEIRYNDAGKAMVRTGLAVQSSRKKADGQGYEPDFFDLTIWGRDAETTAQYCVKGQEVTVVGSVRLRTYTRGDGQQGASCDVSVNQISFGAKPASDASSPVQPAPVRQTVPATPEHDEDIPF